MCLSQVTTASGPITSKFFLFFFFYRHFKNDEQNNNSSGFIAAIICQCRPSSYGNFEHHRRRIYVHANEQSKFVSANRKGTTGVYSILHDITHIHIHTYPAIPITFLQSERPTPCALLQPRGLWAAIPSGCNSLRQ